MLKYNPIFLLFLFAFKLQAQFPNTEIWLFEIKTSNMGTSLLSPTNISNRDGYDNQPSFSKATKKIYYVSVKGDGQADIFSYDIRSKKTHQVTNTPISEYSPVENENATLLNAVVVEKDSAQRIHGINPLNGIHEKVIDLDSVGYYTFLNKDTVIYYKLTEPHSLHYYSLKSNESKFLGYLPIRGFKAIDRHSLIYGLKDSSKVTYYIYDFVLQKANWYCEYPSLNEDVFWHEKLGLLKSEGTKLMRFDSVKKTWIILYDLSSYGFHKITRFAIDPKQNYLIVVDNL